MLQVGKGDGGNRWSQRQADVARMHDVTRFRSAFPVALEFPDSGGHSRAWRSGQLDLDGNDPGACVNQEIDFRSRRGSPEIDLRVNTAMGQGPNDFGKDRRFQDGAAHGA